MQGLRLEFEFHNTNLPFEFLNSTFESQSSLNPGLEGELMTGNTGNNTNVNENEFETLTLEMLPKLTDRFLEQAREDESVNWALGIFDVYPHGMIHMDQQGGFLLQILHPNTIRVIQIFDSFGCFSSLQMLCATCEKAEIEMEIEGYAHITPAPNESQSESIANSIGSDDEELHLELGVEDLPMGIELHNMTNSSSAPEGMWV